MPLAAVCPSALELQRFLLGQVSQDDAGTLEQHLEQCVACQQSLQDLDVPDGLVQTARAVAKRPALIPHGAVDSLMDRLARLSVSAKDGGQTTSDEASAAARDLAALLAPPQGPDEIGRLGPYRVLDVLGSGGMGVVFRAEDPQLGRMVALKVIRPRLAASATAWPRFLREARAAARLRHPAIVPLHEVGQHGDLTYLVYDYVPGPNLAELLQQTQPAPDQAAQWVARIADALDYAHQMGIIHRDVKPANILLDRDNQPLLSDFGLASHKDAGPTLTQEGDILGTPAYMSPEQARGLSSAVDGRSDVYSLGVLLYEALSGTVPFQGSAASVLHQVIHEEPRRPRSHRPGLAADLETICLKAMAKEPARRYATAGDLAADLRRYLRHEPIRARRIGPLGRLWRWCRRNPALAATIALAVTAIALVAAFSFQRVLEERNRAQRLAASLALDQGISLCEKGEIAQGLLWMVKGLEMTPAGDTDLRRAIHGNLGAWQEGLARPRSILTLEPQTQILAASHDRQRLFLVSAKTVELVDIGQGRKIGWPLEANDIVSAAFSPDDRTLVTGGAGGTVAFWDTTTGQARLEPIHHEGRIHTVAFDPQAKWILAGSDQRIQRYDLATRQPVGPAFPQRPNPNLLSPDGTTVLTRNGRFVERWDVLTGAPVGTPLAHEHDCYRMNFSPKGRYLVTWTTDRTAHVWSADTGASVLQLPNLPAVEQIAFDEDEGRMAARDPGNTVRLWDLKTKEPTGPALVHMGFVLAVAFSREGDLLATATTDATVQIWEIATGKKWAAPLRHAESVDTLVFAPAGGALLTLSARAMDNGTLRTTNRLARFWDIGPGRKRVRVLPHPEYVWAAAFAPDGQSLLTGCGLRQANSAQCWSVATGQPLGSPLPHADQVSVVAFSPDGHILVTGDFSRQSTLKFWDAGHKLLASVPAEKSLSALAWSPDGRWLVTGNQVDPYAQQWDAATRQPTAVRFSHEAPVRSVVFSADSKLLLTGSYDKTARLWDAVTGQPHSPPLVNSGQVGAVDISADGRWIVTGNDDRVATIWETATGKPVGPPLPHQGTVRAVAFHPHGHWVLTGSWDKTARLWDRATGKPVGPPMTHDGEIEVARFSPDGRTIVTAGWDKVARLWPTPSMVSGSDERLKLWIEVLTGMELAEQGSFRLLDPPTWEQRRQRLEQLGGGL